MKYCIYCGREIDDNVNKCPYCHHSFEKKNDALIFFLKKHTKEKFLSEAENNLFECLKNYILSHLYGFILTVAIIAVPLSAAAATSGVKTVNEKPVINDNNQNVPVNVSDNSDNNGVANKTLSESDKEMIADTINAYSLALEASGGAVSNELKSIWISDSIMNNTLHHAFNDRYDSNIYNSEYIVNSELKCSIPYAMNQAFTLTGQELMNMGYDIVVVDIDGTLYFENHPDYEKAYPNYYATMVKINDKWYVAEEINTHSRWSDCKDIWILN